MHVHVAVVVGELGENSDSHPPIATATLDTHTKCVNKIPRSFDHGEIFKKFNNKRERNSENTECTNYASR